MKRFYIAILAVATALASCNKMEEIDNPADNQPEIDAELTADQILCAIPQTKTALDENLNVIWSENDEVMVLGADNQTGVYKFNSYVADNNKTAAVFENVDTKVTGSRSAIYPATAYVADSYNGTTAQIALGGVDAVTIPTGSPSEVLANTVVSTLPLVSTPSEETLSFSNLFGGVMFRPYDYMGMGVKIQKISIASTDGKALAGVATVDLATGKMTKFEGTETELTFKYGDIDITSKKGFIAYVPAGEYAGLVITPIDNMGRKFPVTTGAITVNAGKVKQLPELPLTIWYGTTNCYAVAPGATSVVIDATPFYSWRSDYDITKGNVIRVENGNMSGLGGAASVLWQQEKGSTLTDLTATNTTEGPIVNGTITVDRKLTAGKTELTVPLSGTAGNAVVALRSVLDNTNIVWSFHIWVSEKNDITLGSKTFIDRNLGAVSIAQGDRNAYGMYFQWGRKDPFPMPLTATTSSYRSVGDALKTVEKTTGGTISYSIKNPDTRITSSKQITCLNGDFWLKVKNTALWGCSTTYSGSGTAVNGTSIKTVYDPCPAGYRVPSYGELKNAVAQNTGSATKGRLVSNNYFPYSGIIRMEDALKEKSGFMVDTRGYMWSSVGRSSSNEQGAYIMAYNSTSFALSGNTGTDPIANPTSTNRSNHVFEFMCDACPVRCIKE